MIAVAGVLGHVVQHRPLWTVREDQAGPGQAVARCKGLQRMFGMQGWVEPAEVVAEDGGDRGSDDVRGLARGDGDLGSRTARSRRRCCA